MPDDNCERREDGLVEMNGARDVEAQLREETDRGILKPENRAGDPHEERAPHHRPVFRLLNVAKASELRLRRRKTEVIFQDGQWIGDIAPARQQVAEERATRRSERKVSKVPQARREHHDAGYPMSPAAPLESARAEVANAD